MNYIFDFDGTLADSFGSFVRIYDTYVQDDNGPLTKVEIEKLRGMTSRKALKSAGIRWWQIPRLGLHFKSEFQADLPNLKAFEGIGETLNELNERGDKLFIVTWNDQEAVKDFLTRHKLLSYFTDYSTNTGIFNKGKYIKKLVKKHSLVKKDTVYVGDETRDIKAARFARVTPVSVTWGFNSEPILKKQKPKFIIDKPAELLTIDLDA